MNRQLRQRLKTENAKRPAKLTEVPRDQWPKDDGAQRLRVWLSRDYMVQEFKEPHGTRLSVNRTTMLPSGRWDDGLTWEELQGIKREIGYGDKYAIEIYPPEFDVVNVANMRHLWVMDQALDVGWKSGYRAAHASQ